MLRPPYVYYGVVMRVLDGDTIEVDEDHGRGIWLHEQIYRLAGGNARELSEPGGKQARDALAGLLKVGRPVLVSSLKPGRDIEPDKYGGRWVARIVIETLGGVRLDVMGALLRTGWAADWDGTGRRPVPPWPRRAGLPELADLDGWTPADGASGRGPVAT